VYIQRLQGYLKEGISLEEEVRAKRAVEFSKQKAEVDQKVLKLKESVDDIIKELKAKGYEIETRQDIANKKDQLTITGIEIAYQLLDKFCFVKPVETDYLRIEYKKILRNNISRKGHWEIHKYENRIHRCQG